MELEDTALLAKLAFAPGDDWSDYHHRSDSDAHLHGIAFCTKSRSLMHIKQAAYQSNYWKRLYLPNRGTSQSRLGMEEGVRNHCGPFFQKHHRHAMN